MSVKNDLTGRQFGRWSVLQYSHTSNRNRYWTCVCVCGSRRQIPTKAFPRSQSCGCLRRDMCKANVGEKAPHWKGSKTLGSDGYIQMRYPTTGKRCYEQVYVMEQILGRPLLREENVHHLNGIRHDNRPENLELWSKTQPAGQRVADKVEWATELLKQYAPDRLI